MAFSDFGRRLTIRVLGLLTALVGCAVLVLAPGFYAATIVVILATGFLVLELFRFVARTNREVARFVGALRYRDYSQRFEESSLGAGFDDLGEAFAGIMAEFRHELAGQESELEHLRSLVEQAPVPLISVTAAGNVEVWNHAGRRLFGNGQVRTVGDLARFSEDLSSAVAAIAVGERRLAAVTLDGLEHRLMITASQLIREGSTERLISLQNIQSELDGMQLEAWQDLVRVLTHEIMNSITPIASLARTASDLIAGAKARIAAGGDAEVLGDVDDAVRTVAKRSDSLMGFVGSYKQLTRLSAPVRTEFPLQDLLAEIGRLVTAEWGEGIDLTIGVVPGEMRITADRDMLSQVLINLLQNSRQALAGKVDPVVRVEARLNKRGRATIEVADNGPGVDPELARRIFVPFFTTKPDGSGVGLALSRQIMLAHGGSIAVGPSALGGACFTLAF